MAELLSFAETQKLLDRLGDREKKLLEDIVPTQISTTGVQRVLQTLLAERVSIRDLPTILEGIAEAVGFTRSIQGISEHVRSRLARQICASFTGPGGYLALVSMGAKWEQEFAEALIGQGDDQRLAMAPTR